MKENFTAAVDAPKIRIDPPAIHIDVHVHLAPAARETPAQLFHPEVDPDNQRRPGAGPSPKRRLAAVLIAGGILLSGVIGYRAGATIRTPLASNEPTQTLAQGSISAPKDSPRSGTLPESLARELERPPQITPPPGAVDAHTPSGPAAFGLHE